MFWVDMQGNLLSNLKLAFYEASDDSGFFSKMFSDGGEKQIKENLVKSYQIISSIYDDILSPIRL